LAAARQHVEHTAAARAWMEGIKLPLEEVVAYAQSEGG
jgi:hypothetical protein